MTSSEAAPSWSALLIASGGPVALRAPSPRRHAHAAAARGPGGAVGRGAMRGACLANAGGAVMPTFSLPAAIALAILACCAGYFVAWIAAWLFSGYSAGSLP
jgi:hypothetical protein